MARLSEQLKYFVNKKITEDADWAGVEIVLSGHEVPGEGEHKIMEYIRLSKAQPGYNANTRHCLYGLDADLVMLGLLSHDPHFCLLREEVKFGPAARKKTTRSASTLPIFLLVYIDTSFAVSNLRISSSSTCACFENILTLSLKIWKQLFRSLITSNELSTTSFYSLSSSEMISCHIYLTYTSMRMPLSAYSTSTNPFYRVRAATSIIRASSTSNDCSSSLTS